MSMDVVGEVQRSIDRRSQAVRSALLRHGLVPEVADDEGWLGRKFVTRARALFWARLAFLLIGFALLAVPVWRQSFGLTGLAYVVYVAMLLYTVANYLVVEHPTAGRIVTFLTLCTDTLVVVYLIVASGGLRSPLLATELMLTTVFCILFPKPLMVLPPLLTLPVIARIDQLLGGGGDSIVEQLFTLLWFSALNFVIVYVIVFLNEREDARHKEVLGLHRELQDLAVIEERSRLARDIHDGLGASLSGLIIQAEYLTTIAPEGAARDEALELRATAEEAIDELRRSLKMMREDFDLEQAAADHCRTFEGRSRLPISFQRRGAPRPLAPEGQLSLFRVLQEALSNAAKHAQPTKLDVTIAFEAHGCSLNVRDDGRGFDPKVGKPGHYGLLNMRERAKKCGGEVEVRSQPGAGTEVTLTVPYRDNAPTTGEVLG